MAKKDYSFAGYQASGFYTAPDIAGLQKQLSDYYNRSDDQLRSDARSMYETQYDANKLALESQRNDLGTYRDRDIKKINQQYDKAGNQIDTGLLKRGLGRSSLISTKGVENENARNAAVAEASLEYLKKDNEISANMQKLDADYAQNVENKYAEMRDKQISDRIAMMANIANLQQSGYSSYVNYVLNK